MVLAGQQKSRTSLVVGVAPGALSDGLGRHIEQLSGVSLVGQAHDGPALLGLIKTLSPEILILDSSMPGLNILEMTVLALKQGPSLKIIVLSLHDNHLYIERLFKAGVRGYVLKEFAFKEIEQAIRMVAAGEFYKSSKLIETARLRMTAPDGRLPTDEA